MRDVLRDEQGRPRRVYHWEAIEGGRRVALDFALVDGRLVCVGLEVGPPVLEEKGSGVFDVVDEAELDPLTAVSIRLPLRRLVDEALTEAVTLGQGLGSEAQTRLRRTHVAAEKGRKRPGRPPVYGDDHYRQVAAIYEGRLRQGHRDPLQAVMRELKVEKTTAASKVREARRRGFLTMDYFAGSKDDG
jgi:hypothetical protein